MDVKLWKYYPNKSYNIWFPDNYKDYIMPDNKLVSAFTDQIVFREQGAKLLVTYRDGTPVKFIYRKDLPGLCEEAGQNGECGELYDFWMNPDYYLSNNLTGDCEDYALLLASVFERLGIPYMVVGGYMFFGILGLRSTRDWWVEFIYSGRVYLGQVNLNSGMPQVLDDALRARFKPYMMFSKSTDIQAYCEWY